MLSSLDLIRHDYFYGNAVKPKCVHLLPHPSTTKTKRQKVVVGDLKGNMCSFGFFKEELKYVFQTCLDVPIHCISLGGTIEGLRSRIFVCTSKEVQGFSGKGKKFMTMVPNTSEPISSIFVEGLDLLVCGSHAFLHYRDLKDFNYTSCTDTISDVLCLPAHKVECVMSVLACQDRVLRVFKEDKALYEIEVPGKPTTLELVGEMDGVTGREVVYGTLDGRLAKVVLDEESPYHEWEIPHPNYTSGISSLDWYDITADGVLDLLVGRSDGKVEVYVSPTGHEAPTQKYQMICQESVMSVQGGKLFSSHYNEIVCSTYAGCVFGLSTQKRSEAIHNGFTREGIAVIKKLRKEIESLQSQAAQQRSQYQACMEAANAMSALPPLDVQHSFDLSPQHKCSVLVLELPCPLDNVMIQSNVPLDLVDTVNAAVVSFTSDEMEDGNFLLATYRCQANVSRLEIQIQTIEGHSGMLQVYVTPRMHPKMCRLLQFDIKPLSLHRRIHSVDESRPFSVIKYTGQFGVRDVTSWLRHCLPEMSAKVQEDGQEPGRLVFESLILGTQVDCQIKKGEVILRSDNVSTIAILKEVISREATKDKLKLDIKCEINEASTPHLLSLIHPKLQDLLLLTKKVQVLNALKELSMCEEETEILCEEYQDILAQGDQLVTQLQKKPWQLERLFGVITDLFIDNFKFKGQNVKARVPSLLKVLEKGDLDEIHQFFLSS